MMDLTSLIWSRSCFSCDYIKLPARCVLIQSNFTLQNMFTSSRCFHFQRCLRVLRFLQEPFPLDAVCASVWKNMEGQLSFLKHAIAAPPEVFTFMYSPRKLVRKHTSVFRAVFP